jgi:hypothetical protein
MGALCLRPRADGELQRQVAVLGRQAIPPILVTPEEWKHLVAGDGELAQELNPQPRVDDR